MQHTTTGSAAAAAAFAKFATRNYPDFLPAIENCARFGRSSRLSLGIRVPFGNRDYR